MAILIHTIVVAKFDLWNVLRWVLTYIMIYVRKWHHFISLIIPVTFSFFHWFGLLQLLWMICCMHSLNKRCWQMNNILYLFYCCFFKIYSCFARFVWLCAMGGDQELYNLADTEFVAKVMFTSLTDVDLLPLCVTVMWSNNTMCVSQEKLQWA